MKSIHALSRLSSRVLIAGLALAIPMRATAAVATSQLETDSPQAQTTIEEWHWRNMAF